MSCTKFLSVQLLPIFEAGFLLTKHSASSSTNDFVSMEHLQLACIVNTSFLSLV